MLRRVALCLRPNLSIAGTHRRWHSAAHHEHQQARIDM
jgi:hypothetical protein